MPVRAKKPLPPLASAIAALPVSTPFLAPEAIERNQGVRLRLRLGANESAFGMSPMARQAMHSAVGESHWYGDPECYALRVAIGSALGVGIDHLLIGNGIDGLLGYVVRAFVEPGVSVVTTQGTYPTFNYHVRAHGGQLERISYRNDRADLAGLLDAVTRTSARLVYLANPDNPSGTCLSGVDIANFAGSLPPDCMLILDEAYHEFAPDDAIPDISSDAQNVVRLRTFSKAHGMAGLRIGYALSHPEVISTFGKFRNQFEVSRTAEAGALASLRDTEFVESVVIAVDEGRSDYMALAESLSLPTIPSATNFVCFDVGDSDRARRIVGELARRSVFIRMPTEPPLDRCIRVTVGVKGEREEFADILRQLLKTL